MNSQNLQVTKKIVTFLRKTHPFSEILARTRQSFLLIVLYLDLFEGARAEITWEGYVAIEGEVKSELAFTGAGFVAFWTRP